MYIGRILKKDRRRGIKNEMKMELLVKKVCQAVNITERWVWIEEMDERLREVVGEEICP